MEILIILLVFPFLLEGILHLFLGDWSQKFEEDNKENPNLLYRIKEWIGKIILTTFLLFILLIILSPFL
jgi:uncharacterized membrane protein